MKRFYLRERPFGVDNQQASFPARAVADDDQFASQLSHFNSQKATSRADKRMT
jgi:hypothetical protein